MGDSNSSSTWSDNENRYADDDDSNSEDRSWTSNQNVPPEDGHLGGHNEENDPESAYSKNTSEVTAGAHNEHGHEGYLDMQFGHDRKDAVPREESYSENRNKVIASTEKEHEPHGQLDTDVVPDEDKQQLVDRQWKVMATTFDSEPTAYLWYNSYAKEHGFSIRKEKVKRGKGPSREIRLRRFVCSRAGKRQDKFLNMEGRKRRPRAESRCKCTAHLIVKRDISRGVWVVGRFDDNHNHILARPDEVPFLRSHRKIVGFQKAEVLSMGGHEIRKNMITTTLISREGKYSAPKQNTKVPAEENHPMTKNASPLAFHERENRQVCSACNIPGHNRRNKKLCKLHPVNMVQEEK